MMPEYIFPALVLGFLVFFSFYTTERIRKIKNNLPSEIDQKSFKKNLITNFNLSMVWITGCFCVSMCSVFSPSLYHYLLPIDILNVNSISNAGKLLIKISFIWITVMSIQIPDLLDFHPVSPKQIYKIEVLAILSVIMLCAGVFLFFSSMAILLLFTASVFSFILFRNNYNHLKRSVNRDQKAEA